MTDRSKSQRKRRLRLNAEDFAPPADMHQAPEEPRLDEAWVQYYGGEKLGGLKRLTSFDDDDFSGSGEEGDSAVAPEKALTSAADRVPESHIPPRPLTPAPQPEPPSIKHEKAPAENHPQNLIAPIKDFRRQRKSPPAELTHGTHELETEADQSPSIRQRDESTVVILPDPGVRDSYPLAEMDTAASSFESWSRRWSPWLKRGGSIKVCEAFYLLTQAQGKAECFTSNSEIMKRTALSRAQCIRNIHYLIEMGFLDELSEVNNREAKGTYYRFNLVPRSLTSS